MQPPPRTGCIAANFCTIGLLGSGMARLDQLYQLTAV